MSFVISAACWKLQINPTQKSVLMSLADMANDQGYCWPSIDTLSIRTCFGRTAVINALKVLESNNFLSAIKEAGIVNRYVFNLDVIQKSIETSTLGVPVHEAYQSARCTATSTLGVPHPSTRRTPPVHEAYPNHKEQSINNQLNNHLETSPLKTKKSTLPNWLNILVEQLQVSEDIAQQFIAHRKQKKAPLSQITIHGFIRESALAGISVEQALIETVENNWIRFKASWFKNKNIDSLNSSNKKPDTSFAAFESALERDLKNISKFAPKTQEPLNDDNGDNGDIIDGNFKEVL